jgi:shikimate kinase
MELVLLGLRGSGKTTLGRTLAELRRVSFVDLDERTPRLLGAGSVAEAWARCGEAAFREAEVRALREVIEEDSGILALGGGTPMAPGAEELIRSLKVQGPDPGWPRVVYLRAPAPALRSRLQGAMEGRPSLTGADPLEEIEAVLAARDPLYCDLADRALEVGGLSEHEALEALAGILMGA